MNTRIALVALLSLIPATLYAADKSPRTRKVRVAKSAVVIRNAAATAPTTGVTAPDFVQVANLDGSTGFPLITANDWAVFQDAAFQGLPIANCDGSKESPVVINILDYQCFLNRMAAAYAWQQSVANTVPKAN